MTPLPFLPAAYSLPLAAARHARKYWRHPRRLRECRGRRCAKESADRTSAWSRFVASARRTKIDALNAAVVVHGGGRIAAMRTSSKEIEDIGHHREATFFYEILIRRKSLSINDAKSLYVQRWVSKKYCYLYPFLISHVQQFILGVSCLLWLVYTLIYL